MIPLLFRKRLGAFIWRLSDDQWLNTGSKGDSFDRLAVTTPLNIVWSNAKCLLPYDFGVVGVRV